MSKTLNLLPAIMLAMALIGGASTAQADERYTPVTDEVVQKECSACHMAFQPSMLPAKSWQLIMGGLSDHFGEDASLDQATARHIEAYLVENAADKGWWGGKFLRGLNDGDAPLRITETPYWIREHRGEVPESAWRHPDVKSKANCLACHRAAAKGYYDDD